MEEVGVVVDVLQGGAGDDQLEDGPVKVGLLGRKTGLTLKLKKQFTLFISLLTCQALSPP